MSTNRFDEQAATWDDDPEKTERARTVADAIRAEVPLRSGMRLLEYGAGTGLVSQRLQDHIGSVTLADSSRGMLEVLRSKVVTGVFPDAHVWDFDLTRDPTPDERFDVIVTVLVLHHIHDLAPAVRGFATLLERGGHLCVVDLDHEDGSFHDADFDGHSGFDRDALAAELRGAGFDDVRFTTCGQIMKHGRSYDMFLATCTRNGGQSTGR